MKLVAISIYIHPGALAKMRIPASESVFTLYHIPELGHFTVGHAWNIYAMRLENLPSADACGRGNCI